MHIEHPVKIGSLTNIGTIASWKYVRYGFSQYRYFTLEGKESYGQDEITEVYSARPTTTDRRLDIHVEQLEQPSIIQKLMEDPTFKRKIEEIAQNISDKYPEKR